MPHQRAPCRRPLIGYLHVRSTGKQASGLEQAHGLAKLGAAKPARYRMFVMYGVSYQPILTHDNTDRRLFARSPPECRPRSAIGVVT